MATTLVSVERYLRTSYPDGDCEYVDGEIVEPNLGEIDHAGKIVTVPPHVVVEVLSPDDRAGGVQEKLDGILRAADPTIDLPPYELLGK
jgi:Uma2 family endonuclease